MHKQRLFIAIAAGIGMLATFLPWMHAPIVGSINGTAGDGWITFGLFAIALIIALVGAKASALSNKLVVAALVPPALAGLIGLWKIIDFHNKMGALANDDNPFAAVMAQAVGVDIGLYLVVIAGIAIPPIAFGTIPKTAS